MEALPSHGAGAHHLAVQRAPQRAGASQAIHFLEPEALTVKREGGAAAGCHKSQEEVFALLAGAVQLQHVPLEALLSRGVI